MTDNGSTPLSWADRRQYREEGFEAILPDGDLPVKLRSVDLGWFLTQLNLTDLLTPLVDVIIRSYTGEMTPQRDAERRAGLSQEEAMQEEIASIAYYYEFARFALVSPKLVDNPQGPDEIGQEDLSAVNARWIYQRATLPLEQLKRVCEESKARLVNLVDEPGPGRKTKRAARSGAVGQA